MVVGQPSVAGLAAIGLLLLALTIMVPGFIKRRRTIVNVNLACELSPEAHLVTTKTPGHGGPIVEPESGKRPTISLVAGHVPGKLTAKTTPAKEPTMSQLNATATGSTAISVERAAYLEIRAARCRRRLQLTLTLLAVTALTWGAHFLTGALLPALGFPRLYALVPTGILVLVLTLGRLAARSMKASDAAYFGGQNSSARRLRNGNLNFTDDGVAEFEAYSDDVEYENDDPDFEDDEALPYVNDQVRLNAQMGLPTPATQMIPEADLRLAIENHLKDDPEMETNWNLGRVGKHQTKC